MTGRRTSAIILLASITALILSPLSAAAASTSYKVRRGDTLWGLARKHHLNIAELARANGLSQDSSLKMGATIRIPAREPAASPQQAQPTAARSRQSGTYYVHTRVDDLSLRTGPSTGYGRIALLPAGTTGKLLGCKGNWAKIALEDGTCGFVFKSLVQPGQGSTDREPVRLAEPPSNNTESSLVGTALACRGIRYRSAGTSRGGFDCSGFTRYIYAKYGVSLPHSSAAQARLGRPVSRGELAPGDLVFFHTYRSGISHVGIYVGSDRFVHAARHGRGVTVDSLSSAYYAPRYRGARRVK